MLTGTRANTGVILLWQGVQFPNNSVLSIEYIGEGEHALVCQTDRRPCCRTYRRVGQWYYPNGTIVPIEGAGYTFYRDRSDKGEVRLHQRAGDDYTTYLTATGLFCCVLPDASSIYHTLCIGLLSRQGMFTYIIIMYLTYANDTNSLHNWIII